TGVSSEGPAGQPYIPNIETGTYWHEGKNTEIPLGVEATEEYRGIVKKSVSVSDAEIIPIEGIEPQVVTTLQEAQDSINSLVSAINDLILNQINLQNKLNEKLLVDRGSGQQSIT